MRRAVIKNKKRGFTLIELMAAVAITLLVITGSLLSFVQLMFLADSSVNLTIAANDAQYVLEQIYDKYKKTALGVSLSYPVPVFDNIPPIGNLPPNETITLTFNCTPIGCSGNLATITVDVGWKEKNQDKHFILSTCIAK